MHIHSIPSDVRKTIYPFLDYKSILAGRAVCKKWCGEIESLWPIVEKCSFADFKKNSLVISNLKKERFKVCKFDFNYSYEERNYLLIENVMIRVLSVWSQKHNRHVIGLETLNMKTKEIRTNDVSLGLTTSPNLIEIDERGLMEVPGKIFFKALPNLMHCVGDFFCLYRFNLLSIWNVQSLECIFSQPNVLKQLIFKATCGIGYVTLKNQIEIWDFHTKKLDFSYRMPHPITSCSSQHEDWIVATISSLEQTVVINVSRKEEPIIIKDSVRHWHIRNGTLRYIDAANHYFNMICLKTGKTLFRSEHAGWLCSNLFTLLKNDCLEVWDMDSFKLQHSFPRPCIREIKGLHYDVNQNRIYILGQRDPRGIELTFYDLTIKKPFGLYIFKELRQETNQPSFGQLAGCLTFSYLADTKEHVLFFDRRSGKLIEKMAFKKENFRLNDRLYEILDSTTFKEYRFDETHSNQGNRLKELLQGK